jgi:hypothetical protein
LALPLWLFGSRSYLRFRSHKVVEWFAGGASGFHN